MKFYIETSIWNFLLISEEPEKQEKENITQVFFEQVEQKKDLLYISPLVIEEIEATRDIQRRNALIDKIESYNPTELPLSEKSYTLARKYVEGGAVTYNHLYDATHLAYATVGEIDTVVSWNMRHIVRLKTRLVVQKINLLFGYKDIQIATPEEVIDVEET